MKINIQKINFRHFLNILCLIGLSSFLIFTPVVGKNQGPVKPQVKAAFVSEPVIPVSKGISAPSLTATGIFIMDLDSGAVLYDKNPHEQLKPASLTKIMTSLVALDYYQDDSVLRVINGQNSVGNTAKLVKGDELSATDVLYAMLIPSGNDAAVTLAENYPGGYRAFVDKMNQKAAELGLQNTHFVNVSGIESPGHYTSAYDIAMIARTALNRLPFSSIVSTKDVSITSLKGHTYNLASTNILLGQSDIFGVKTGWTPEAGECLVLLAERDNHRVLVSLLNSKDRFGEGRQLVDWTFNDYSWF